MQYAAKFLANGSIWLVAAAISPDNSAFASGKHDFSAHDSSLVFSVQILGLLKKSGQFTDFNGRLELTAGEAKTASVWLIIRSNSAQMRSKKDTEMVKGANFFAAAEFPEVRFESEPFEATLLLDNKAPHPISGYLSLRGKRLSETLNLQVLSCKNLAALETCSFQVSGKLGRARYGMQSHRAFVGDDVRLTLTIQSAIVGQSNKAQKK